MRGVGSISVLLFLFYRGTQSAGDLFVRVGGNGGRSSHARSKQYDFGLCTPLCSSISTSLSPSARIPIILLPAGLANFRPQAHVSNDCSPT